MDDERLLTKKDMCLLMQEFFEERHHSSGKTVQKQKCRWNHKVQAKQELHEEMEDEDPVERRRILVRYGRVDMGQKMY